MTIGDNPSGQATSTAKYVVITCARSKADKVKKWMRVYLPLDDPYQELAGRMVTWIPLNRHIPQVTWAAYNKHQITSRHHSGTKYFTTWTLMQNSSTGI